MNANEDKDALHTLANNWSGKSHTFVTHLIAQVLLAVTEDVAIRTVHCVWKTVDVKIDQCISTMPLILHTFSISLCFSYMHLFSHYGTAYPAELTAR